MDRARAQSEMAMVLATVLLTHETCQVCITTKDTMAH